jgi:phytoene dehydrogenase-like protein
MRARVTVVVPVLVVVAVAGIGSNCCCCLGFQRNPASTATTTAVPRRRQPTSPTTPLGSSTCAASNRGDTSLSSWWNPPLFFSSLARNNNNSNSVEASSANSKDDDDDDTAEQQHSTVRQRQWIATLIDRALVLHQHIQQQQASKNAANKAYAWMNDQLDSLLYFLSVRWQQQQQLVVGVAVVGHDADDDHSSCAVQAQPASNSSRQSAAAAAAAVAIEQALLQRASTAHIEALVQEYDRQVAIAAAVTATPLTTPTETTLLPAMLLQQRELRAVEQQLDSFAQLLLLGVDGRTTTSSVQEMGNKEDRRDDIGTASSKNDDETVPPNDEPKMLNNSDALAKRTVLQANTSPNDDVSTNNDEDVETEIQECDDVLDDEVVDVAIVGAGLGGLCAGAILNTVYGKKVGIYESHYLAGGCAHAFDRRAADIGQTFTFDSGPTILLGCSSQPYNALRQVLDAVGQNIEWIPYAGWGMIENPGRDNELRWRVELGPDAFEQGPLKRFGGELAVQEFKALQAATKPLMAGASIPAMAMRSGSSALVPLLRYFSTLIDLIKQGETLTGTFAPFMNGPLFTITSPWLRNWLDALAFSLSGLPASRTAAAAMAFILNDMHRPGAALDYPKGGMGEIVNALVRGVEQGDNGSKVHLRQHVDSIDCNKDATRISGITLRKGGKRIRARDGVICNAPVWSLRNLIKDDRVKRVMNNGLPLTEQRPPPTTWITTKEGASIDLVRQPLDIVDRQELKQQGSVLARCDTAEMTASFMHLHLAIDAKGMNLDDLEAHYTVMDRSLGGDGSIVNGVKDGPCGVGNMIAVSNPCVIDRTLAPEGYILVHAYGAGNEPYELWESLSRGSPEYAALKEKRAESLWRAVESVIPDVRERTILELIGSPLTHERFLRRPRGTYGSATEDYLKDGSTPYEHLLLASDGIFPGIGVPSVAIAGASAANSLVNVFQHWRGLDGLKRDGRLIV